MNKQILFLMVILSIGLLSAQGLIPPSTGGNITVNYITVNASNISHNNLSGLQGGSSPDEYYHLNLSVFTEIMANVFDWVTSTEGDSLWCKLTGCTITGGLNVTENFTVGSTALFVNANTNQICVNCDKVIGDNVLQADGNVNFSTFNLTVGSINITTPDSVNFIDDLGIISSLSAQHIVIPELGVELNILSTDASIFGNIFNTSGSGGIVTQNTNDNEFSTSGFTATNNLGNSVACLKFGINYTFDPKVGREGGVCGSNFGNFLLIARNDQNVSTSISFYDEVNRSPLGDTVFNYINLTQPVIFYNKNHSTPFLTVFNNIVEFVNETIFSSDVLIDANLNVTDSVQITNNLTVGGNIIGNSIYGGMYINNQDGVIIDLITLNVWENITNFTNTKLNGFSFANNQSLTSQFSGVYGIDYSISFADSANSELGFVVGINGVEQNQTRSQRKIGTGGDIGNTGGTGIIELNVGDVVTLMARDENNPVADITISSSNFKIVRVGNL